MISNETNVSVNELRIYYGTLGLLIQHDICWYLGMRQLVPSLDSLVCGHY
jgi:hypothetical protein